MSLQLDVQSAPTELIHYHVNWRVSGIHPGAHAGHMPGTGTLFRGHGLLLDHPDPRRLDVRASARDPFHRLLVKVFQQQAALPVWVVADWSASMGFRGNSDKRTALVSLCDHLAWSVWRMGDRLGFIACNDALQQDMLVMPRCSREVGIEIRQRITNTHTPSGTAMALAQAVSVIGRERALVFLVSDFHFPDVQLRHMLEAFSSHDVVPVVLWDRAEYADLPRWGLARVRDAESGEERLLWLRPALRAAMMQRYEERRQQLVQACERSARPPFFIEDYFQPSAMNRYFTEYAACA